MASDRFLCGPLYDASRAFAFKRGGVSDRT